MDSADAGFHLGQHVIVNLTDGDAMRGTLIGRMPNGNVLLAASVTHGPVALLHRGDEGEIEATELGGTSSVERPQIKFIQEPG